MDRDFLKSILESLPITMFEIESLKFSSNKFIDLLGTPEWFLILDNLSSDTALITLPVLLTMAAEESCERLIPSRYLEIESPPDRSLCPYSYTKL